MMLKKSIDLVFLMASYNRKAKTLSLIRELSESVKDHSFLIFVVDNNSTDGTREGIQKLDLPMLRLITTPNDMYWAQCMTFGYEREVKKMEYSFLIALNDDISLRRGWYDIFCKELKIIHSELFVLAYSFKDDYGNHSYGGLRSAYTLIKTKLIPVLPNGSIQLVDTINFNFVVISSGLLKQEGFLYKKYIHGLADFDFGFKLKSKGYPLFISGGYLGICNRNDIRDTSADTSLSLVSRIKRLHSIKEQPLIPRIFYFLRNDKIFSIVSFFFVYASFLRSKLNDYRNYTNS